MIDMSDNAKVSNILHSLHYFKGANIRDLRSRRNKTFSE